MPKHNRDDEPILSPRMFEYRKMKCACIEINGANTDHVLFELYVGAEKAFAVAEVIKDDPYFRILVAMLYDLSIREMEVRIFADEAHDEFHFYISCTTIQSKNLFVSYANNPELRLFAMDAARSSTIISVVDQPFAEYNVTVAEDQKADIQGFMHATLMKPLSSDPSFRFFYPYGVSYTMNVTNEYAIDHQVDDEDFDYSIWNHVSLFTTHLNSLIATMEMRLSRYLSPTDNIKIEYDKIFLVDQPPEACRYAVSVREILIPKKFNGIEITEVSPSLCVCKPKDNSFFDQMGDLNTQRIFCSIERMMSALMSTNDMLYIPEAVEHDIKLMNGDQFLEVRFIPHICRFNQRAIFTTMQSPHIENAVSEFFWIQNATDDIIVQFPTGAYLTDICSLGYLRINRAWAKSYHEEFMSLIYSFSSPKTRLRIIAETELWMIVSIDVSEADETEVEGRQGKEFFDPKFIGDLFLTGTAPNTIENVLRTIYAFMIDTDDFSHALDAMDENIKDKLIKMAGSRELATIMLYDEAVHMHLWPFYPIAQKIAKEIIKEIHDAAKKAEREEKHYTTSPQVVQVDNPPTSPVISGSESIKSTRSQKASVFDKIKKWFG